MVEVLEHIPTFRRQKRGGVAAEGGGRLFVPPLHPAS